MEACERFFQNRACPYFPCHGGIGEEDFNCLFCYCPLYTLGSGCGGDWWRNPKGFKDCSACTFPHRPENYERILARYRDIMDVAARTDRESQDGRTGQTPNRTNGNGRGQDRADGRTGQSPNRTNGTDRESQDGQTGQSQDGQTGQSQDGRTGQTPNRTNGKDREPQDRQTGQSQDRAVVKAGKEYEGGRPPRPLDGTARAEARARWDEVAKPLHSLGVLEDMIVQIAGIQGTADIALAPRCVLVFCADHGVTAEGVAQSGSEVTALVARAIAEGGSNVNLMAGSAGADVFAVDMGMEKDVPGVISRKIARGTADMVLGPAMSRGQAEQAVRAGMDIVRERKNRGYRMIAVGEMGIGNTTAGAAMVCALLNRRPEDVVGRGAGLSDEGLRRKTDAVRRALAVNRPDPGDPLDVLAKVGGFEIAGMTGAFLGGALYGVPMVIDGVVSAVSALTAVRLCPGARDFLVPSHMSREPAARIVFREMEMKPVLEADLALGEGTGAVLLFPLLDAAAAVCRGAHTFTRLGIAPYQRQEDLP